MQHYKYYSISRRLQLQHYNSTRQDKASKAAVIGYGREPLLKGMAQYSSPPCTNWFKSAAFDIANIIYFLTKQDTLMRWSTVLSLPLQLVVFPGGGIYANLFQK